MLLITLVNDKTGSHAVGNYDCRIFINRTLLATGRVENYDRADGWQGLVKKLSENTHDFEDMRSKILTEMFEEEMRKG